jgi:hypothetical protein
MARQLPSSSCGQSAGEIEGQLTGPVALAAVEAAKLRAEGWQILDSAVAKMAEADKALFLARLEVRRDQAQRALDEHLRAQKSLYGPRTAARKAEEKAAGELATATREHGEIARAEELARRMMQGVAAETEAAIRLDRATEVLRRYKAALAEATAARQGTEDAVSQGAARAAQLEKARDEAVAAYATPGRIALGAETITSGIVRLLLAGKLDEVEQVIAGQIGKMICAMTGASDDIVSEARRELLAEQERDASDRPVWLKPLGDGRVRVMPNPLNPATPQPYRAPATPPNPNLPGVGLGPSF